MVSRNFSATLINEALGTNLTQTDVITVSSMEDEAVAQVVGGWNAMSNTKQVSMHGLPEQCLLNNELQTHTAAGRCKPNAPPCSCGLHLPAAVCVSEALIRMCSKPTCMYHPAAVHV